MIGTDKASLVLLADLVQSVYAEAIPPSNWESIEWLTWSHFCVREPCGVIATQTDGTVVVAFRGTEDVRDMLEDCEIAMATTPEFPGCRIHRGFLNLAESVQDSSGCSLRSALEQNIPIMLTGHSAGGSVARIWSRKLRKPCKTFAEARSGDAPWANWGENTDGARVTNLYDLIPHLPAWSPWTPYRSCAGPELVLTPPLDIEDLDPLKMHSLATLQRLIAAMP